MPPILSKLFVLCGIVAASTNGQDLAFSRRLLSLAPSFISSAERKVEARPTSNGGSVLVLFRTSEQGNVIDVRPIGGNPAIREAAATAVRGWKFKPTSIGGQPVEMHSALTFDFSTSPITAGVPKPMSAQQLSPTLGFKCLNSLLQDSPETLQTCKQQLEIVGRFPESSPMEWLTAHDEFGLALLKARKPKDALKEFDAAVDLAREGLKESDAEWAYTRWHRATAEQDLGQNSEAEADLGMAEDSMHLAEQNIGDARVGAYYRGLFVRILKQHADLLESQKRHDEAQRVLTKSQ